VVNGLINGVEFIREVFFIYFKESKGRLVSNVKLEGGGGFAPFEDTSKEVSVFFPF
jgi:hypothetical protein